jgi:hypothetical protein
MRQLQHHNSERAGSAAAIAADDATVTGETIHASAYLPSLRDYSVRLLRLYVPFRLLPRRKLGRGIGNFLVRDAAEDVFDAV